MEKRSAAFRQTRHFRALEIYLAVERHQQLHSRDPGVIRGKRSALVHKLISQIFDGMTQYFQGVPGFGCNAPPPVGDRTPGGAG